MTDCELCGDAVVDASVHPCCAFWVTQEAWESVGCVACNESRKARRGRKWKR